MLSGRFAPSPTGPLHMGSLVTAVASYLDILSKGGRWHVRIDNIDPPRETPNASQQILEALRVHALDPAAKPIYQNDSENRLQTALSQISSQAFYCRCSRAQLRRAPIYPGTCRAENLSATDAALRLQTSTIEPFVIEDGILAPRQIVPEKDIGDFIIRRRDGLWAYNFATAVDDGYDFSHVFRGQDLSHTTELQVAVMKMLGLAVPSYSHLPLLRFADGDKLSKQTHAPALDLNRGAHNISAALFYLGFGLPNEPSWSAKQWLAWALDRWPRLKVPKTLPVYTAKPVLT